jgi:hypothetical protein
MVSHYLAADSSTDCTTLSGSNLNDNAVLSTVENNDNSELDHILIQYNGGNYQIGGHSVNLNIEIECGGSIYQLTSVDESDPLNPKITITSSAGCKVGDFSAIWEWM